MTRASASLRSTFGLCGSTSSERMSQLSTVLLAFGPGRDPSGARSVGYTVEDDRNQHGERGEVEDPLPLGDSVAGEHEQREGHRRHALRAEPGHEAAGGDARAG